MTRLIILLALCWLPASDVFGDDPPKQHSGVELSDSDFSSIKNISVHITSPDALTTDTSGGYTATVTSMGRPTVPGPSLNPFNLNVGGEDKKGAAATSEVKFGVSAGGKDGLMQTQVDSGDVVQSLTLPDGSKKNGPVKDNGQPLRKTDLANLATGRVKNINLMDGTPLGSPSCPQGG